MRIGRILLIDDDSDYNFLNTEIIQDYLDNVEVLEAGNGKEAFTTLQKSASFDLIFLDLNMPVMNGWELLDALKGTGALDNSKVIILSSSDLAEDRKKAENYQEVIDFRTKPLTEEYLDSIIELVKYS